MGVSCFDRGLRASMQAKFPDFLRKIWGTKNANAFKPAQPAYAYA